jgi:hypothetical protein
MITEKACTRSSRPRAGCDKPAGYRPVDSCLDVIGAAETFQRIDKIFFQPLRPLFASGFPLFPQQFPLLKCFPDRLTSQFVKRDLGNIPSQTPKLLYIADIRGALLIDSRQYTQRNV